MPALNKTRSMTWTLNNYTPEDIEHIKNGPFKFVVFQQEVGASGTPHLQGYCQMGNPTGFNTWRKLVSPRAHFEASKGSPRENYDYCTKEASRAPGTEFFTRGDIPSPGHRSDIEGMVALAKDPNKRMRDLVDANGEAFLKYYKGLDRIRSIFSKPRDFPTRVYWLYGSTGTGKSRLAQQLAPDAYWKPNDKWFDGYDPNEHEDIIIDDFRASFAPFNFILRLFDCYPMFVEIKGGTVNFRPRRIFVTTSKHPNQTWLAAGEEKLDQLLRRLEVIVEFLPGGIKRFEKGSAIDLEGSGIVAPVDHVIGGDSTEEEEDLDFLHELDGIEFI